jgi:hypothetical protein
MHPRQGTFTGDLSPFRAGSVIAFIVLLAPCDTPATHATFRATGFKPTSGGDPGGELARTMRHLTIERSQRPLGARPLQRSSSG